MSDVDRPHAPPPSGAVPGLEADAKRCSLILCTRNRPELLSEAVASVLAGRRAPDEIVVIDQSDAPHPELCGADPGMAGDFRYVHSASRGLSRGVNEGIRLARYPLLVFTHDDVVVTPEWLGTLVDALVEEGPEVVLTGQVVPSDAEEGGGFAPSTIVDPKPARYRGRVGQDVIYPHNMAMHRAVFERVGPLDPLLGPGTSFPSSEDNDLCHRLLEAGYEIRYVPEAVIYHKAWRTRSDYLQLRWGYGRGQGAYYAKHLDLRDRFMARRFAHDVRQRFVRLVRRWNEPLGALGELTYLGGLLSGAAQWLLGFRGSGCCNAP